MLLLLWIILTGLAAIVVAIASVVIASRLIRIVAVLEQLNTALRPLRTNSAGISTVIRSHIRSQEEAIKASREVEEDRAKRLLLGEE
jgi:hypothetical protein